MYKLLALPIALGCALVLLPGPALAQAEDIIEEFCDDFARDVGNFIDDTADIAEDLAEAVPDYDQCSRRADDVRDEIDCVERFVQDVTDAVEDSARNCRDFTDDFIDAFEVALDDAADEGVSGEFLDDDRTQEKLLLGLDVISGCSE